MKVNALRVGGFLFAVLALCNQAWSATETVQIPMTFDYSFIRALFVSQLYTAPGEKAVVVDEATGGECTAIELWKPNVAPEPPFLKVGSNIKIHAGIPLLGKCIGAVDWEGYIEVLQRVYIDSETSRLRFETVDSHVYKQNHEPATIATKLWSLIKDYVHPYMSQVTINTALPVGELREIVPFFFSQESRTSIETLLNTLTLGSPEIRNEAVTVNLLMKVEVAPPAACPETAVELSPEEIDRFAALWESWDAFLVFQIERLVGETLTEAEQVSLYEVILENRHGFVRALSEKKLGRDLVRNQFAYTWQQLSAVLRTHLIKQASTDAFLRYLTFFAASDALVALDKLGPTLGFEISRDGLLRLARLLSEEAPVSLDYSYSVDSTLRNVLGFGPPLDESGPAYDVPELLLPPEEDEKDAVPEAPAEQEAPLPEQQDDDVEVIPQSWIRFLFPTARAAEASSSPRLEEIKQWSFSGKNIQEYLNRIEQVLNWAADATLSHSKLPPAYHQLYRLLVPATAWQESCWRQFIRSQGKLKYLLSYNQTSVGIMQINERVWRGMYRPESLRWNIHYNARAGAQILHHYLHDCALQKINAAKPIDKDTLGRAVYAMYNGGPGEFSRFLERSENKSFYKSDQLFWKKYSLAKQGDFEKISVCFTGQ